MSALDSIKKLPPWAWILAGTGAIGLGYVYSQQAKADALAAQTETSQTDPTAEYGNPSTYGDFGVPADYAGLQSAPINYDGNLFGGNLAPAVGPDTPPANGPVTNIYAPISTGGGPPVRPNPNQAHRVPTNAFEAYKRYQAKGGKLSFNDWFRNTHTAAEVKAAGIPPNVNSGTATKVPGRFAPGPDMAGAKAAYDRYKKKGGKLPFNTWYKNTHTAAEVAAAGIK